MCARIVQLILAAMLAQLIATVAAFQYLVWWQAILASVGFFLLLMFAAKLYVRYTIGRIGNLAAELFRTKSRVLAGATVDVHRVVPTAPRATETSMDEEDEEESPVPVDRRWFEVEVTIFPASQPRGGMQHWDIDDLRMVPAGTPPIKPFGERDADVDELELYDLQVVADGQAVEPEGSKFNGPQRLLFVIGPAAGIRELTFRYYFEQFGSVKLSGPALPARGGRG